jgi:hypothetical protein
MSKFIYPFKLSFIRSTFVLWGHYGDFCLRKHRSITLANAKSHRISANHGRV